MNETLTPHLNSPVTSPADEHVFVQWDDNTPLPFDEQKLTELCQKAAMAAAEKLPVWQQSPLPWMLTVRLGGDDEGRQLNRDFRGKDYPTNVLSFPTDDEDALEDGADEWYVGDIFVCLPVVEKEAAAEGKTVENHLIHLVVHGVLHLGGHDHMDDDEATLMEGLETAILRQFGIDDPYAENELIREDH